VYLQITLITFGWVGAVSNLFKSTPLRSVPVGDDPSHRVHPDYKGRLAQTPREGVATLYDLAKDAFARYGSRNCMGTRVFKGWKTPGKVKHFGDIEWLSFAEVGVQVHKFGAALRSAGMKPAPSTTDLSMCTTPSRMVIYENTCAQWMIAAMGAFSQGITVVTAYATLGVEAVIDAVKDNSSPVIVCNKKDVAGLVNKCKSMPSLKYIVYTNDLVGPDDNIELPKAPKGVTIVSFKAFIESGNTTAYPATPPSADTCAVVMYTSGSTGKPKGVVVSKS